MVMVSFKKYFQGKEGQGIVYWGKIMISWKNIHPWLALRWRFIIMTLIFQWTKLPHMKKICGFVGGVLVDRPIHFDTDQDI